MLYYISVIDAFRVKLKISDILSNLDLRNAYSSVILQLLD